jgi:hypothetical protein
VERRPSFLSSRTYTRPTNRSQPSETTRVTAEIFKEAAFSDPEILSDAAVVLERVDEHFFEESRKLDEDLDRVLAQHHLREPVQAIVRALIDDSPDQVGATDTVGLALMRINGKRSMSVRITSPSGSLLLDLPSAAKSN